MILLFYIFLCVCLSFSVYQLIYQFMLSIFTYLFLLLCIDLSINQFSPLTLSLSLTLPSSLGDRGSPTAVFKVKGQSSKPSITEEQCSHRPYTPPTSQVFIWGSYNVLGSPEASGSRLSAHLLALFVF